MEGTIQGSIQQNTIDTINRQGFHYVLKYESTKIGVGRWKATFKVNFFVLFESSQGNHWSIGMNDIRLLFNMIENFFSYLSMSAGHAALGCEDYILKRLRWDANFRILSLWTIKITKKVNLALIHWETQFTRLVLKKSDMKVATIFVNNLSNF